MDTKNLPVALPGGALIPFMGAKRFQDLAWAVYHEVGGFEKLVHVVRKSDDNYKWYMEKLFVKAQPKAAQVESQVSGIETLLKKAQQARDEGIIDITPTEVEDAD